MTKKRSICLYSIISWQ